MQNNMKSSASKTVVVRLTADNVQEFEIDVSIFDDPYLEAATRAVEKVKASKHGIVRAVTECWDKKDAKKPILYNSYWVLVNAACYAKAEQLREKFRMQTDCDLAKDPIHGRINRSK
jgi:hypothetical protein